MRPDFVTTGSTVYAVNEIVNYLTPLLTGNEDDIDKVSKITRHVGRFDKPNEVKNWMSGKDGGIRIAALRVRNIEQIGVEMQGDVDFVAYVFCTELYGYSRDQRSEVIAGRLAKLLLANGGVPTAKQRPERLYMDNMYSGDVDGLGLAIWSVSWTQKWVLDKPIAAADLDDFVTMHATAEIADGAPVMDSDITLDQ